MHSRLTLLLAGAAVAALGACSKETNVFRGLYTEAGSELDTHDFGNSTMQNTQVMASEETYAINLTRKFAADVPNTINFGFNSAVIEPEAQVVLRQQADWIRQFPEIRFKVFGHTDLVGSNGYNKALGLQRARAVVAFLASQGISPSRLEAVVSFGETQPLVYVQTENRQNRRTVTEVSGFVGGNKNPAYLNGKYAMVVWRDYVKSGEPPHVVPTAAAAAAQVSAQGG